MIKKGDNIIVISGKDKGKKGVVVKSYPKTKQVIIDGINVHKKTMKPKTRDGKGSIVDRAFPIHMSNVMVLDSKGERSRLGAKTVGKKKVRVAKTTKTEI